MNKIKILIAAVAAAGLFMACNLQEKKSAAVDLTDERQAFSYALGVDIGGSLDQYKDELNVDVLIQGLRDTLVARLSKLPADTAEAIKKNAFERIKTAQTAQNVAKEATFLNENKIKAGVTTTESGLQYTVIAQGEGDIPTAEDMVEVHYTGSFLDGREFDSSRKRGEAIKFKVGGVIPGWTELLQLMKVGSRYKAFIPSRLAYGPRGAGRAIPPNTMLVFDVELISIVKE